MFTIEQRREAYQHVVGYLQKKNEGVCRILGNYARDNGWIAPLDYLSCNCWPEFHKQRPVNASIFWWPFNERGREDRISALNRAIELTYAECPAEFFKNIDNDNTTA